MAAGCPVGGPDGPPPAPGGGGGGGTLDMVDTVGRPAHRAAQGPLPTGCGPTRYATRCSSLARPGVAAKAAGTTSPAPACRRTSAAACSVAPVVTTSSRSSTRPAGTWGWARNDGPVQAAGAGAPGLRRRRALAFEEPPARHPQLPCDVPGHELGLVEAALAAAPTAGRRPCHDVDAVAGRHQAVDEQPGEVPGDGSAVAVLEAEQDVAHAARERHRDEHARRSTSVGAADEREATGAADRGAGGVAASAAGGEDHDAEHGRGVSQ